MTMNKMTHEDKQELKRMLKEDCGHIPSDEVMNT